MNKILLENDKVRVLNTTFQPQEKAPMHHHPDTIVYVLSGGKLAMKTKDKTDTVDFQKDKATYLSETTHEIENIGSTTVDLIVVELKK
jgi:quercetin dioxygenase-like cupin family protein